MQAGIQEARTKAAEALAELAEGVIVPESKHVRSGKHDKNKSKLEHQEMGSGKHHSNKSKLERACS